jgi:protein-disulfide isomerase
MWYAIKPIVKKLQQAKDEKRQYLRLKFKSEVFETLLERQKQITIPVDGLGIMLGNPDAQHEIVKVCNPYCNPCALAHPKLEKILEENPNVKARIIFNATNEETDYRAEVVKHLLAM